MARAVDDPGLRIAFWLPDPGRFVDANGRPAEPLAPGPGRTVTSLVRRGQRVAVIDHLATVDIDREAGPALRLAADNERLRAQALAKVEELRASRTRIVETGDAERRRLERDLHDGAQQRLLALSYDIRLARASAMEDGDAEAIGQLDAALADAQVVVEELRDVAHGIYPAVLGEAGLSTAFEMLADDERLRVELTDGVARRFGEAIENAAYVLVADAIDDAAERGARRLSIESIEGDGRLVVTVTDDGTPRTGPLVQLADRIGAVGGRLEVGPAELRADIPCA
jgi:signal transduction histidine kinase